MNEEILAVMMISMIPKGVNSGNILAEIFIHDGNRHRLGTIDTPKATGRPTRPVCASLKPATALNSKRTVKRLSRPRPT